jgi:hypothetical protein
MFMMKKFSINNCKMYSRSECCFCSNCEIWFAWLISFLISKYGLHIHPSSQSQHFISADLFVRILLLQHYPKFETLFCIAWISWMNVFHFLCACVDFFRGLSRFFVNSINKQNLLLLPLLSRGNSGCCEVDVSWYRFNQSINQSIKSFSRVWSKPSPLCPHLALWVWLTSPKWMYADYLSIILSQRCFQLTDWLTFWHDIGNCNFLQKLILSNRIHKFFPTNLVKDWIDIKRGTIVQTQKLLLSSSSITPLKKFTLLKWNIHWNSSKRLTNGW